MEKSGSDLDLPGFRFHPTEEELLDFYLKKVAHGRKLTFDVIGTLNVYLYDPWDLPGMARIGEREWYFFVPRDRRSGNGGRPNRRTEKGFWKATGSDRAVRSAADPKRPIGLKKTLVFYRGRAPRGSKTDWVMNEYRLPDHASPPNDIVLCKIYRKATSLKELEQRAAVEEDMRASISISQSLGAAPMQVEAASSSDQELGQGLPALLLGERAKETKEEEEPVKKEAHEVTSLVAGRQQPVLLPELEVPKRSFDWTQDPFWTQLRSPWLDYSWSPYANLLNF